MSGFGDAVHAGQQHHRPIPFHRPNVANAVSIQLQLIFRLPEKALDRPALGVVTQDVFVPEFPVGAQDAMKMFRRHRLIRLPSQQHHRVIEAMDGPLIAIHAITLLPHRDEAGVFGLDIAGKLLGLDGDAFRVENPVRLEHRDDMESLFQTGFDELLRRIPRIHEHIHRLSPLHLERGKHLDRQVDLAFSRFLVIQAERKWERLREGVHHQPNERMPPDRLMIFMRVVPVAPLNGVRSSFFGKSYHQSKQKGVDSSVWPVVRPGKGSTLEASQAAFPRSKGFS